ncbi:MAG: hypothetical protein LBH98_03085, partial [Chitinispirillales bacterium]|nr:hypothetical protein [Chitinispirillales bacterium]
MLTKRKLEIMATMSGTAKVKDIISSLFKTARTVCAHMAVKLNSASDVADSSLTFTPPTRHHHPPPHAPCSE